MGLWTMMNEKIIQPVVKAFGSLIKYQENDPSTPELAITTDFPSLPNPCPPFGVMNFNGSDAPDGTVEHQAAEVYCTIVFSLRYVQQMLQKPIVRWPALTKLIANPRSGKMFNAYYDRYYLNFFYDEDPQTHQMIYTCDSTDVVAHELGHAILDCIRPDLWAVQCVEIQAFHESFGDINAILTALTFPEMVKNVLQETSGDLKHDNVVSRLAEQMGLAIFHAKGGVGDRPNYALRNANNIFKYVPPESLPTRAPDEMLAGEPHSFSRIFTGAWYDSLTNVYNAEKSTGKTPEDAIASARDKMARITYNAVRYATVTSRFFQSVLRAMLTYDQQNSLGCGNAIRAGFSVHDLFAEQTLMTLVESKTPEMEMRFLGDLKSDTVRISDFTNEENPLYKCIVEMPSQPNIKKSILDDVLGLREAIDSAKHSLKVLTDHDRVGTGPTIGKFHEKEFTVIEGKLLRNYFCCGCRRSVV